MSNSEYITGSVGACMGASLFLGAMFIVFPPVLQDTPEWEAMLGMLLSTILGCVIEYWIKEIGLHLKRKRGQETARG